MKIAFLLGTRPEAIKSLLIIKELKKISNIQIKIWVSHQHLSVVEQILNLAELEADIGFDTFDINQSNILALSKILKSLDEAINNYRPDWLFVQGDTLTALVGALAGFYSSIKVAHLEAGLRSFNKKSPFPEETNRILIAQIAHSHFAPSEQAYINLIHEGVQESDVIHCGNFGLDLMVSLLREKKQIIQNVNLASGNILVTIHRKELLQNDGAEKVFSSLIDLAIAFNKRLKIIFPLHPNPEILDLANSYLNNFENIILMPPLPYQDFIDYLYSATLIITDSGGIQDEAMFLEKPLIIMRESTEREIVNLKRTKLLSPWDSQLSEKLISFSNELIGDQSLDIQEINRKVETYSYNAEVVIKGFLKSI